MPNIVTGVIDVAVSSEQIGGGMLRVNATLGEDEDGGEINSCYTEV